MGMTDIQGLTRDLSNRELDQYLGAIKTIPDMTLVGIIGRWEASTELVELFKMPPFCLSVANQFMTKGYMSKRQRDALLSIFYDRTWLFDLVMEVIKNPSYGKYPKAFDIVVGIDMDDLEDKPIDNQRCVLF